MTTSALRRQVKNIVHNYSEAEIKVREATSNDPWGPPSSLMSEIADLTFNTVAFAEVMGMIWRRLNDSGKNWRHVYKALTLLDYLIKTGSEKVAHQCRENLYTIQTLKEFQYIDRDGKDQGINVREKVKQVMGLLKDEERLKQERAYALKTKERMSLEGMGISSSNSQQLAYGRRASQYGEDYGRSRESPSSFNSSSSSPRFNSDLEQARPQTTGEEELQLQLALAMSREEAEKQPLPPVSSTDEDLQLQIALTLSKQEHEKEVRAWQGENSLLQRALEESHQDVEEDEEKTKKSQSSVLELADIFGPAPITSTHTSADPWDIPGGGNNRSVEVWNHDAAFSPPALSLSTSWEHNNTKSTVESTGTSWGPTTDPWVPLSSGDPLSKTACSTNQGSPGPWNLPHASSSSASSSDPWGVKSLPSSVSSSDPWGKSSPPALVSAGTTSAADPWGGTVEKSSTSGSAAFDLFAKLPEHMDQPEHDSSGKSNSPVDVDLFGDLIPSTKENGVKNKDVFDIAGLGDSLPESKREKKDSKTPEAFLGPNASSLVNLDSLVTAPQNLMSRNPFLAGLSTPSPTNPFNVMDQPKPTLNQMRTSSPVPTIAMGMTMNSMTYSASLPLPLSSIPPAMALPASMSAFPQTGAGPFPELPGNLPQPLLPLSGSGPPPLPSQGGMNPFL
ncbi:epsin-3 isoform X1 [Lacerta agilis]|uniref:epsin-3 isoform X1 n=1 Tax=Lacerta agilis TaxID=80427 RepID=UPI0014192F52|nr:epsin-3 isoform X1 [Lacerta agilis]XP_032995108.1 epsin-3 isoform X1 [Lacerta agilis]